MFWFYDAQPLVMYLCKMFAGLKGNGRLWIYVASRNMSSEEEESISQKLSEFFASWQAHGNQLTAGFEVIESQAIVLAVDEEAAGATGCSIDKATALIKEIDQRYQLDLFNRLVLPVYTDEGLSRLKLDEAKTAYAEGKIDADTLVLNTTITQLAEVEKLQHPLKENWIFPRLTKAIENA